MFTSVLSALGSYSSMNATHSFILGWLVHCGSVGSMRDAAEMMPWLLSRPAGRSVAPTEAAALFMICSGFQPSAAIFLIACAANFGVETLRKTSALDACRRTM